MSTWARTTTGDLVMPLIGQGGAKVCIVTDEVQSAAIRIQDGLQMWLGDWAFDTTQGFPWQAVIGVKGPSLPAISNLLRKAILTLGAPVVLSVTQLRIAFFSSSRDLKYAFQAQGSDGATIVGGSSGPDGLPFVVIQ
jgi:hypothetical protein